MQGGWDSPPLFIGFLEMTFMIAEPFRPCHSEERSDEESRLWQGAQFRSNNEMHRSAQHDISLFLSSIRQRNEVGPQSPHKKGGDCFACGSQ